MKIQSAKAKGRKLCQELKELLLRYAKDLHEDDITVTPASVPGPDLHLSHAAKKFYPFNIECKNQEKLNIWDSLKQVEVRQKIEEIPLVVFSRNRSPSYVCLRLEAFMDLMKHGTNGFSRDKT